MCTFYVLNVHTHENSVGHNNNCLLPSGEIAVGNSVLLEIATFVFRVAAAYLSRRLFGARRRGQQHCVWHDTRGRCRRRRATSQDHVARSEHTRAAAIY